MELEKTSQTAYKIGKSALYAPEDSGYTIERRTLESIYKLAAYRLMAYREDVEEELKSAWDAEAIYPTWDDLSQFARDLYIDLSAANMAIDMFNLINNYEPKSIPTPDASDVMMRALTSDALY